MSQIAIPVGCSIYSLAVNKFGVILRVDDTEHWYPYLVVEYENGHPYHASISDYEECILEGRIIAFDKLLTEEDKLVVRLKYCK